MCQVQKKDVRVCRKNEMQSGSARRRLCCRPISGGRVEELRLRAGRPLTLVCPEGERTVPGAEAPVRSMDLSLVLEIATQASAHTALERVRNGFFTVRGGHRIGICGSGVVRDGEVRNLRQLSSLAIRVAREVPGLSAAVLDRLWSGGVLQSTLLLSPPGGGKTTLLRDLIRAVSDGEGGPLGQPSSTSVCRPMENCGSP